MSVGQQILKVRTEQAMTQETFGALFHVTRQTVSNWENEKSYPDLQTLVAISDYFQISLDVLLKGDSKMIETVDKERMMGTLRREKAVSDFFNGAGIGIIASCFNFPPSTKRVFLIIVGFLMLGIGWYKRANWEQKAFAALEQRGEE